MTARGLSLQGFQEWLQRRCEMLQQLWCCGKKTTDVVSNVHVLHWLTVAFQIWPACNNMWQIYKMSINLFLLSALCLLEGHAKRKQQKYKEEPADARSKRFESERKKFSLLLAEMIREAGLPVADTIKKLDDPKEGWLRVFSTRRANTLKNRYKAWKPFRDWLEIHRSRAFPLSLKDVVDYMQFRMNESCGKSVPVSFSTSLHLMELVGRVGPSLGWICSFVDCWIERGWTSNHTSAYVLSGHVHFFGVQGCWRICTCLL